MLVNIRITRTFCNTYTSSLTLTAKNIYQCTQSQTPAFDLYNNIMTLYLRQESPYRGNLRFLFSKIHLDRNSILLYGLYHYKRCFLNPHAVFCQAVPWTSDITGNTKKYHVSGLNSSMSVRTVDICFRTTCKFMST